MECWCTQWWRIRSEKQLLPIDQSFKLSFDELQDYFRYFLCNGREHADRILTIIPFCYSPGKVSDSQHLLTSASDRSTVTADATLNCNSGRRSSFTPFEYIDYRSDGSSAWTNNPYLNVMRVVILFTRGATSPDGIHVFFHIFNWLLSWKRYTLHSIMAFHGIFRFPDQCNSKFTLATAYTTLNSPRFCLVSETDRVTPGTTRSIEPSTSSVHCCVSMILQSLRSYDALSPLSISRVPNIA